MNKLPDIQEDTSPEIPQYINRVGISNVKIPIIIADGGLHENVTATTSIFIDLMENIRAISMSEFFRKFQDHLYKKIDIETLKLLLIEIRTASKEPSCTATITFNFDYSMIKITPKSNISFPMFYHSVFKGRMVGQTYRFFKGITVPYTSYCPCSSALCESSGIGNPHNQRSFCDLFVELLPDRDMQFCQLISIVEKSVINQIYPVLRRADEQFIAGVAYTNKFFVEDSIRRITSKMVSFNDKISDWAIRVRHEESIHQHDAVAMTWKGNPSGMDENIFMNWRK